MSSDYKIYCQYMEEIKGRSFFIRSYLSEKRTLGNNQYDYELLSLQLRRILELIVFSNLAAHKDAYSEVHEKYARERSASRLIERLEQVNPEFYPKPIEPDGEEDGIKKVKLIEDGFLTVKEWIKLYNLCSKVLHVWNPYVAHTKNIDFELHPLDWLVRIERLLNEHYVHLPGDEEVWIVQMKHPEDGKVHVFNAK